jgi:hypothetical protein
VARFPFGDNQGGIQQVRAELKVSRRPFFQTVLKEDLKGRQAALLTAVVVDVQPRQSFGLGQAILSQRQEQADGL